MFTSQQEASKRSADYWCFILVAFVLSPTSEKADLFIASPPPNSNASPTAMGFAPPKPRKPDPQTQIQKVKKKESQFSSRSQKDFGTSDTYLARRNAPRGASLGGPPA